MAVVVIFLQDVLNNSVCSYVCKGCGADGEQIRSPTGMSVAVRLLVSPGGGGPLSLSVSLV